VAALVAAAGEVVVVEVVDTDSKAVRFEAAAVVFKGDRSEEEVVEVA
jgi:hypothetical protein